MKKCIFILIVCSFVCSSFVQAADGDYFVVANREGVRLRYRVLSEKDATLMLVYNPNKMYLLDELIVPGQVVRSKKAYTVTTVSREAFINFVDLYRIVLPSTITLVKGRAFYECFALTTLTFDGKVPPTLEADAFHSLTKKDIILRIPEGSKSLYENSPDVQWRGFARYEPMAKDGMQSDEVKVWLEGNRLFVESPRPVSLFVYSLSGRLLYERMVATSESLEVVEPVVVVSVDGEVRVVVK